MRNFALRLLKKLGCSEGYTGGRDRFWRELGMLSLHAALGLVCAFVPYGLR